ncbi:DUF4276 family protein [Amycolatopsis keratiniphila]|uniref:DUF4276 family protein n=1 Tax=Amycolatopsis keratiniphila TaxID=129921 RepID=UPI00087B6FCB|nr:DUF4276 family protein [Amycolatopsis keratiniphila]OLZ58687.1 hypothetical protein BS330_09670 [Amycolatopsis keratiniphila subsp. nogabecina]SDU69181.1 protein of unknown function [Amycolatopsis keratiniphila]
MRQLRTVIAVEGATDNTFFSRLLSRALEEIGRERPGKGFDVDRPLVFVRTADTWRTFAQQVLDQQPGLNLVFFHYDGTSNPEREAAKSWVPMMDEWANVTSGAENEPAFVPLVPIREMESWALADSKVVNELAGVDITASGVFEVNLLPKVEKLTDPKRTLAEALRSGARRRRQGRDIHDYLDTIAQRSDLERLRAVPSFKAWQTDTETALRRIGFIE